MARGLGTNVGIALIVGCASGFFVGQWHSSFNLVDGNNCTGQGNNIAHRIDSDTHQSNKLTSPQVTDDDSIKHDAVPLNEASLVILGTAKNIYDVSAKAIAWSEKVAQEKVNTLLNISAAFKSVRMVFYENDSNDGTLSLLHGLSKKLGDKIRVEVLSESGLVQWARPKGWGRRTEILAHGRNKALKHIETFAERPDFVLVLDLDHIMLGLTAEALATCSSLPRGWGGCCANQKDFYYDLFALRTLDDWVDCDIMRDCNQECRALGDTHGPKKTEAARECHAKAAARRQKHIPPTHKAIEVSSCFGGAALYDYNKMRPSLMQGAKYFGMMEINGTREAVCEHVGLHASVKKIDKDFRLYINPQLLNQHCRGGNCHWDEVNDPQYQY
eukprot:m.73389 g.73389  ORF g.73389 m.73389 type:complete len:386 (-) comp24554_c0_seq1:164-1321(-)